MTGSSDQEDKDIINNVEIQTNTYSQDAKSQMDWRIDDYNTAVMVGAFKEFKIEQKNPVILNESEG